MQEFNQVRQAVQNPLETMERHMSKNQSNETSFNIPSETSKPADNQQRVGQNPSKPVPKQHKQVQNH